MQTDYTQLAKDKLKLLTANFATTLDDEDEEFMKNLQSKNLAGDDPKLYRYWEWTQGVGLYGLWKMYSKLHDKEALDILLSYYKRQIGIGFPAKNINTTAPLLALSFVYEYDKENKAFYENLMDEWAYYLMTGLPKTEEGGFQHLTSDTLNHGELWDDTLFMAVLFLANRGKTTGNKKWVEEAKYQFLLHARYLSDKKTGLWYHGFTFIGRHNFAEAFWGRGNSWITMAIPELFSILSLDYAEKKILEGYLMSQIAALCKYQDESGMWHTLVDDKTSYLEASATAGFGYGILKAYEQKIVGEDARDAALKAVKPIIDFVSFDGVLGMVSYGTPMGRESKDFYKEIPLRPMPYGQSMAMLFLIQYLIMSEQK